MLLLDIDLIHSCDNKGELLRYNYLVSQMNLSFKKKLRIHEKDHISIVYRKQIIRRKKLDFDCINPMIFYFKINAFYKSIY